MTPLTRRKALAAGATALPLLAGCFGPNRTLPERPTGEWRHHAHDAQNTGSADVTVPPRATPAWDAGEAHVAAPLVGDGTVYSVAQEVTALDAKNGNVTWETDLSGKADHTPALLDDVLIVAAADQLVALDRADGEEVWVTSLSGIATGAVTATTDPSLVTVPVEDKHLQAVDPETGDRLWTDSTQVANQAAIAGGTVYVTGYRQDGESGVLRAVVAADGSEQWAVDIDHPDTVPVVANEGLLVGDAGTLAVHNPTDGTRQRILGDFDHNIYPPPAVTGDTAFLASGEGVLHAISIADGSTRWRTDAHVTAGITVGREAVVAPVRNLPESDLPGIVAFELSNGFPRWEHPIEGFDVVVSTPAVLADGAVFFTSNESIGVVALGDLPSETG